MQRDLENAGLCNYLPSKHVKRLATDWTEVTIIGFKINHM